MREITSQELPEVIESNPKVLVDFYSETCAPCKTLAMILEKIESDYEIVKVQVDADTAERYCIRALPHVIIFNDAEMINEFVGLKPKTKIEALLV